MLSVIHITDDGGTIVQTEILCAAQAVHRQLRPQLPADYARRMAEIFADGARMAAAFDGLNVHGLAVYRQIENTAHGRELYVDDLVTDAARRSRGVGKLLLDKLEGEARSRHCAWLTLDSGTQREDAHRFYFRERMSISSFHFARRLD